MQNLLLLLRAQGERQIQRGEPRPSERPTQSPPPASQERGARTPQSCLRPLPLRAPRAQPERLSLLTQRGPPTRVHPPPRVRGRLAKHLGAEAGNPNLGSTQPLVSLPTRAWNGARRSLRSQRPNSGEKKRQAADVATKRRAGVQRTRRGTVEPRLPPTLASTPGARRLLSPAELSARGPAPVMPSGASSPPTH